MKQRFDKVKCMEIICGWWRSAWRLCCNWIKFGNNVLNVMITCYIMLVGYMI